MTKERQAITIDSSSMYGTYTVEVEMTYDGFSGSLITKMGGNTHGVDIIQSIASALANGELDFDTKVPENEKHAILDKDGYLEGVYLFDKEDGERCEFQIHDEFDLAIIVGIRLLSFEKRNS